MVSVDLTDIAYVDNWLDDNVSELYKNQPLGQDWARISKIGEELGEAIQAFIGSTGQNPRKGIVNDQLDVLNELCDVAATAIYAIQHFTKNEKKTALLLNGKLLYVSARIRKG